MFIQHSLQKSTHKIQQCDPISNKMFNISQHEDKEQQHQKVNIIMSLFEHEKSFKWIKMFIDKNSQLLVSKSVQSLIIINSSWQIQLVWVIKITRTPYWEINLQLFCFLFILQFFLHFSWLFFSCWLTWIDFGRLLIGCEKGIISILLMFNTLQLQIKIHFSFFI